jgi:hypothetical protein
MNTLVRNYLLVQTVFILVVGAVAVVALVAAAEWIAALGVAAAWLVFAFLFRRLVRYEPEPTKWVWERDTAAAGEAVPHFSGARVAGLAVVVLLVVAAVAVFVLQLSGPAVVLVAAAAVILFLLLAVIGSR